jgi:hypothetical protein
MTNTTARKQRTLSLQTDNEDAMVSRRNHALRDVSTQVRVNTALDRWLENPVYGILNRAILDGKLCHALQCQSRLEIGE